ncbi:MAG: hypothetical protein QN131_05830 [Armatimonadota bacterium]|nr:hypothetical protein [Armatimonadota bacterium]MDR7549446.1 hypothetical protein [Armatimonadota bacterium]
MRFTETDLRWLARVVAGDDERAAEALRHAWEADPDQLAEHIEDDRVLRRLQADDRAVIELSPRFLFTVLLARIRRDLAEVPYTVERVDADGRVVVFDAHAAHELLRSHEMFAYLVDLLVSFERAETMTIRRRTPGAKVWRLNTLNIDDMMQLANLVAPGLRPMVFRRIGDIALFTTGIFPEAVVRGPRRPLGIADTAAPLRRRLRLEDYEAEGRRFYRLAADRLIASQPVLAQVLTRLAEEFTAARKPLNVLAERYVAWSRPHWRQLPS